MLPGVDMKAVLFDMDGVILDSKEVWFRVFNEIGNVSREEFEEDYWGRDLIDNLHRIGEDRWEFCSEKLSDYLDDLKPIPGAREALERIDLKRALITNTTLECTRRMLEVISMGDLFPVIISSDMVKHAKPDPEPVLKACDRLGIDPSEAYMIGDSPEDMESGSAAGCTTVGLGVDGDHSIRRIGELLEIIGAEN